MLKPVSTEEKLEWTLRVQTQKAIDEILTMLLDENYTGFVDIWAILKQQKKKMVLDVQHKKIKQVSDELSNENCVRYHVLPGKGVKLIKK